MSRVLGIDPSLSSTGIAVVERGEIVEAFAITAGRLTGYERVQHILDVIQPLADSCDYVGIEGAVAYAHGGSAVGIHALWGVLTHQLWASGHEAYVVPPASRMTYATGKGNAKKDLVLAAAVRRYVDERINGNDIADAVVIAALLARLIGEPIEDHLPQTHLRALDKLSPPPPPDRR